MVEDSNELSSRPTALLLVFICIPITTHRLRWMNGQGSVDYTAMWLLCRLNGLNPRPCWCLQTSLAHHTSRNTHNLYVCEGSVSEGLQFNMKDDIYSMKFIKLSTYYGCPEGNPGIASLQASLCEVEMKQLFYDLF